MKIPKVLTICFIMCCIFAGNVFAQFHGITFLKQTDPNAPIGSPVNVSFRILNNADECLDTLNVDSLVDELDTYSGTLSSGEILDLLTWNFTGGAAWNNATTKDFIIMPFGSTAQSDPYAYYTVEPNDILLPNSELIDQAFLGWTDTCAGGVVCGNCATNPEVASASGATTVIGIPCIKVTKDPECEYSKVGDTVNYYYTIENCGTLELELVSVVDDKIGDLTGLASASGCDPLPPLGSCTFGPVPYDVQPGDDTGQEGATLVNVVDVNYVVVDSSPAVYITDSNDAEVTLLHPNFTVTVDCNSIDETTACFDVVVSNTGDVDLDITDYGGPLPDFTPLGKGKSETLKICIDSVEVTPCNYEATLVIDANGTIPQEYCELPNVLERSDSDTCSITVPGCDGEGCTPGFWKNHPACWCDVIVVDGNDLEISEATLVSDVWIVLKDPNYASLDDGDRKSDFDTDTLADALRYRGGPGLAGSVRNMLRHATAALLNACSADVSYGVLLTDIIEVGNLVLQSEDPAAVQFLHTLLAEFNEDFPCPIDAHCRPEDEQDGSPF